MRRIADEIKNKFWINMEIQELQRLLENKRTAKKHHPAIREEIKRLEGLLEDGRR